MALLTRRGLNKKYPDGHTLNSQAYRSWSQMKARCDNPHASGFKYNGALGIKYPPEWETFERFIADMGWPPRGYTLARIRLAADYSVANCVWAPAHRHHPNGVINPDHIKPPRR